MDAWEMGLKTTYYLRTLAASQVSKTVTLEESGKLPDPTAKPEGEELVAVESNTSQTFKACSITDPDCEACQ
jgi:ribonucleoside-diphosphate reductase alpha chain